MNSLLQKHGCANVFTIPEGLKELLSDITREVLRDQPPNILSYIANYLAALLITREHGLMAIKILEDLCDCKLTVEELLQDIGLSREAAENCAQIIQESFDKFDPEEEEKLQEKMIVKKLMCIVELSLEQAGAVCKIIQDVYSDYWLRKQSLQQTISTNADEPWEVAAQRTIDIYKTTRPTLEELVQATIKIQAAYRGYHVRREIMLRLRVQDPEHVHSVTTALDVAGSREIDLGPKMNLQMDHVLGRVVITAEEEPAAEAEPSLQPEPQPDDANSVRIDKEMSEITGGLSKISSKISSKAQVEGSNQGSKFSMGLPPSETQTAQSGSKYNVDMEFEDVSDHSRSDGGGISGNTTDALTSASTTGGVEQSGAESADEVPDLPE